MRAPSVTEYYGQDHVRLDRLFKAFQALKATDRPQARGCFQEFAKGLKRHIVWEETILFPLFEEKTGLRGMGPTEVMRLEHQQIKELLATIDQRLQEGTAGEAEEAALTEVLAAHNHKEESILYPTIDSQMTDAERRDVFAGMEKVPHG